jgi:glycosyltransferase involved in cell wall biosynthesis
MPKIVLVTLVHNRKHLVGLALQSAVNQTLPKDKWVHLIIDNASTDGADKVCEVFEKKHKHIHFVRMGKNLHQMPAYNKAIEWIDKNYPKAEVLAQLDSDDMLYAEALEKINQYFNKYPEIGMTYSNFSIIGSSPKNKVKIYSHPKAREAPNQFTTDGQKVLRKMQISGNVVGHMRALRISCLKDIGGFDETYKYSTDYNMACAMLQKYSVVKINGKPLYMWREHGDQVQGHSSPEQTKNYYELKKYYTEKWKKEGLI